MTCDSITCATVVSTTSDDAPGSLALTETCGGTMSGNCAIGMARSETNPAIAVTSAITTASRGRSTKIDENIASAADRLFNRYGHHSQPRPQTLHATHCDEFAAGQPLCDDDRSAHRLPDFHASDSRLPVLHNEDVDALLVCD